jgi:hypothetical protein
MKKTKEVAPYSDGTLADRFAKEQRNDLRYDAAQRRWYIREGRQWNDAGKEALLVLRRVAEFMQVITAERALELPYGEDLRFNRELIGLGSYRKIRAVLNQARWTRPLLITAANPLPNSAAKTRRAR